MRPFVVIVATICLYVFAAEAELNSEQIDEQQYLQQQQYADQVRKSD